MAKDDKNKQYSFALIAIVAIVAIVGIVMMFMNANPMLGTSVSTSESAEQESLLGAAAATACKDSDGGKNYGLKGTVTKGTNKVTDYCLADGKRIIEYYCANTTISSVTYDCRNVGKVCSNGACVKPPVCGNGMIETGEECDSSNLNGQTCISKGFTSGTLKCTAGCLFDTTQCITSSPPFGNLDSVTCDKIGGWAKDPDWNNGISIHFYLDYPSGQGPALTGTSADKARADLCNNPSIGCNHAFDYVFTADDKNKLVDGNGHKIYAYALGKNASGADDGINAEISASPKTFGPCNLISCTDSDGGRNYYVKGTTKGPWAGNINGPIDTQVDVCVGNTLQEFFCDQSSPTDPSSPKGIAQTGYNCPYGCSNGACTIPLWCNDTDGGRNYEIVGTTFGNYGQVTDTCAGSNNINEYYCGNDIIKRQSFFMGPSNSEFMYMAYSPTSKIVTFEEKLAGTSLWDVNSDGYFTIITGGKEYLFRVLNMSYGSSPVQSVDILTLKEKATCSSGACSNGACLTPVNETDRCLFFGSDGSRYNYCDSQYSNCSGISSCYAIALGPSGATLNWSSNCLGTTATTLDGRSKNITFTCNV